jgi:cytochrome P450
MTSLEKPKPARKKVPKAQLLPYVGALLGLMKSPLTFYEGLQKRYGNLVQFDLVGKTAYLVLDPSNIEMILSNTGKLLSKGYERDGQLMAMFGSGLVTSEGPFWFRQRKTAAPAFNHERLREYGNQITLLSAEMIESWMSGQVIDIHHEFTVITLRAIMKALFGTSLGEKESKFLKATEAQMKCYVKVRFGLDRFLPPSIPTRNRALFAKATREIDEVVYDIIEQHRQGIKQSDFISLMMQATNEEGEHLTEKQLRDEVATMILAGHETSSNALAWTIYLLSQNRECDALLEQELTNQLSGRRPTFEDLKSLPYTNAVIKESMRLMPPVWGVSRQATADFELGGYLIPKDSIVMLSQWVVHRDEANFKEPLKFRPERWLNGETDNLHKFAYFPFGGGPRVCIGNSFSQMEIAIILADCRSKFQMEVLDPETVKPRASVTLGPAKPIRVKLHSISQDELRRNTDSASDAVARSGHTAQ